MFSRCVRQKLHEAKRSFVAAMEEVDDINQKIVQCPRPEAITISTMNIEVCLNVTKVSLTNIKALMEQEANMAHARTCFSEDVILQKDREFNNSLIIKFRDSADRTIAIKLFVNGRLQVSGCKLIEDALMHGQKMCRFLEILSNTDTGSYTVIDFDVHMINCNFCLGSGTFVNLARMSAVAKSCNYYERYDANNHAGLIISLSSPVSNCNCITVMVFSNANVIMTGFRYWKEMVDAYGKIVNLFDTHPCVLMLAAESGA